LLIVHDVKLSLTISFPVLASPVSSSTSSTLSSPGSNASPTKTTKVQAEAFEKSNSFEKEGIKIADILCAHKQYEFIKDVSSKYSSVSDGNDTETSSFGFINNENEVKNQSIKLCLDIR
jgi:hypothetical protein